ncbi:PIG-L family deacetylase (plasmid) [Streptomyces viridifaciens]|nr:PIG-L family deacetylase [Streptomyces viridifaciens]
MNSLSRQPKLLCIHAHPDDEALWTGGVLARAAAHGTRTAVVTCTNGVLAEGESFARPGTRLDELGRSLRILGAGEPQVLGYRDSGSRGSGDGSLCSAPREEVVGQLVEVLRREQPDVVVTYDAYGIYGHPDHIRTHEVAVAAVEAAALPKLYPDAGAVWTVGELWLATVPMSVAAELGRAGLQPDRTFVPDDQVDTIVDVRPWLDIKWQALSAHVSEFARGGALTALERTDLRELALGTEYYLCWRAGLGPGPMEWSRSRHSVNQ